MEGILVVDKPKGMTSHDVVDFIRKRFGIKKVGHAGTLDPSATGILVILLGKSTKKSLSFANHDKEYVAAMTFGTATDTYDADGKVISGKEDFTVSLEELKDALKKFEGQIEQIPPMISAIKYKGRKLYELARKGIEVERKPRKVFIKEIEVIKLENRCATIRVVCSKGTYIRSLCNDIGNILGCGAHLSELRRIRSGNFTIDKSLSVVKIKDFSKNQLQEILV